jgi:LacI family transcriptional regulator
MSPPTIVDIARAAGVSIKTVSRVINREPGVSQKTKEAIEAVVAKLNYTPNAWARSLRSTRSYTIALLSNYIAYNTSINYAQRILGGALDACSSTGYHLMVERVRKANGLKQKIEEILKARQIDGLILIPPESDNERLIDRLQEERFPFVRISPYKRLDIGSYVQVNDWQAAYEMTKYLLEIGHRDIALVRGPTTHGSAAERYRGFMIAMEEGGGRIKEDWIVRGEFDINSGMQAGEKLFSGRSRPTAVLAGNDDMAIGVMSAGYRHGLSLPRDVSVAGIDGNPIAEAFCPPLTTMSQPILQIGQVATKLLIESLNNPGLEKRKVFPFKKIVRESTLALPSTPDLHKRSRSNTSSR